MTGQGEVVMTPEEVAEYQTLYRKAAMIGEIASGVASETSPGAALERQARPYSKAALLQKANDARDGARQAQAAARLAEDQAKLAAEVAKSIAGDRDEAFRAIQAAQADAASERADRQQWARAHAGLRLELEAARQWRNSLVILQACEAIAFLAWLVFSR